MATWILVGNQSLAKLFTREKKGGLPTLVKTFDHPEGRLHSGDLVTDKGAAVFQSNGSGQQRSTSQRVPVTEQEATRFANDLAEHLRDGRHSGHYQHLSLVCAPEFLGQLREALDDATAKVIDTEVAKNIADQPTRELVETLHELL